VLRLRGMRCLSFVLDTHASVNLDHLQRFASELVKLNVDIIVTNGTRVWPPTLKAVLLGALLATTEQFARRYLGRIVDPASSNRLPAMYEDRTYVESPDGRASPKR
jgi:hypothetical protein